MVFLTLQALLVPIIASTGVLAATPSTKTLEVTGGYTYSYTIAPAERNRSTYLLLHGFPSASYDWRHQIRNLSSLGYGVIAPDLLGYGDTSKPTAVEEYGGEAISNQVAEILKHEGISKVVGVGHDWGANVLGSMWYYHRDFFSSLAFLATPYTPVGPTMLNVSAVNAQTEAAFGYPIFGYWSFLNQSDAASIIDAHIESFDALAYADNATIWQTDLCPTGKVQEWLEADKTTQTGRFVTAEELKTHSDILRKGGYTAPVNWYKATMRGLHNSATLDVARQRIDKPVLFISGGEDAVARPDTTQQNMDDALKSGLISEGRHVVVPGTGHWVQLEQPSYIAGLLANMSSSHGNGNGTHATPPPQTTQIAAAGLGSVVDGAVLLGGLVLAALSL